MDGRTGWMKGASSLRYLADQRLFEAWNVGWHSGVGRSTNVPTIAEGQGS